MLYVFTYTTLCLKLLKPLLSPLGASQPLSFRFPPSLPSPTCRYALSFIESVRGVRRGDKVLQVGVGSGIKVGVNVWKVRKLGEIEGKGVGMCVEREGAVSSPDLPPPLHPARFVSPRNRPPPPLFLLCAGAAPPPVQALRSINA